MQLFNTNEYQVTAHKRDWDGAKYDSAWDDGSAFPQNHLQIPQNQEEASSPVETFNGDETSFPQNHLQIPQNQKEPREKYSKKSKSTLREDLRSKSTDCWYTPPHIIELINLVLGEIDLDPCADDGRHIPSRNHYTFEHDGLQQQWEGRVYMNPPYSYPGRWMAKLQAEFAAGRVTEAIALVPAATDTNWLSPVLETQPICFWKGRIKFLDVDYQPKLSARQSHVLIYWGDNPLHFKEVFKNHGVVNLPECVTLACFRELVDLKNESKLPYEISPPSNSLRLTPMPKKFYKHTSPIFPSTTILKPFPPELENTSFTQWAFPVSAQALQETEADLTTSNQVRGLKPCDASPKADPNLSSSKTLLDLSKTDFEQFLEDSSESSISTKKPRASGWLEKYTKNKKLKDGTIRTFPKIEGIHRDPQEPTHWYWAYKYEEKSPKAKSANGFITRAVSVSSNKVYFVRYAIVSRWSVSQILQLIKSGKT